MSNRPVIVWFRQDLRLADNAALLKAAETGRPIVPLFVLDDETAGKWSSGGATRWWLHKSLEALRADLEGLGAKLVLRKGRQSEVIPAVARDVGAAAVYFNRQYEPWAAKAETAVREDLTSAGTARIEVRRFAGALLREPQDISTKDGTPYKVYTPFWRALNEPGEPRRPLPKPERLNGSTAKIGTDDLADWKLLPGKPDWASGLRETWSPGRKAPTTVSTGSLPMP